MLSCPFLLEWDGRQEEKLLGAACDAYEVLVGSAVRAPHRERLAMLAATTTWKLRGGGTKTLRIAPGYPMLPGLGHEIAAAVRGLAERAARGPLWLRSECAAGERSHVDGLVTIVNGVVAREGAAAVERAETEEYRAHREKCSAAALTRREEGRAAKAREQEAAAAAEVAAARMAREGLRRQVELLRDRAAREGARRREEAWRTADAALRRKIAIIIAIKIIPCILR